MPFAERNFLSYDTCARGTANANAFLTLLSSIILSVLIFFTKSVTNLELVSCRFSASSTQCCTHWARPWRTAATRESKLWQEHKSKRKEGYNNNKRCWEHWHVPAGTLPRFSWNVATFQSTSSRRPQPTSCGCLRLRCTCNFRTLVFFVYVLLRWKKSCSSKAFSFCVHSLKTVVAAITETPYVLLY